MSANIKGVLDASYASVENTSYLESEDEKITSARQLRVGMRLEQRIRRIELHGTEVDVEELTVLAIGKKFVDGRRMYFHEASTPEQERRRLPRDVPKPKERWSAMRPEEEGDRLWMIVRKEMGGIAVDVAMALPECGINQLESGANIAGGMWTTNPSELFLITEPSGPREPDQV